MNLIKGFPFAKNRWLLTIDHGSTWPVNNNKLNTWSLRITSLPEATTSVQNGDEREAENRTAYNCLKLGENKEWH